jgi:carbon starvation protein
MSILGLTALSALILLIAWFTYGKLVNRWFPKDRAPTTPAHRLQDDVDYTPTRPIVLLGHHFASIAGAGPIVGPIIAVTFGWVPAVIWILVGGIFFGAVHDLGSLRASLQHDGKSIGAIIKQYVGLRGKRLFLVFSFATLVLIIAVFTDIIARTFIARPAVAGASLLFIIIAVLFGKVNATLGKRQIWFVLASIIGVALTYASIPLGHLFPLALPYGWWVALLLVYAFSGSVLPVHILLQPRDYLNSFLLYGLMIGGVAGIVWSNPELSMDSSIVWHDASLGYLFPVLFITIACGAISGFHSLVASGTTAKQLDKHSHARPIAYGGMLIETFLAILAVGAVAVLSKEEFSLRLTTESPVPLFASGLGGMIATLGISEEAAASFVALAVAAFAITTLDTCTRLARFSFQELCEETHSKVLLRLSGNRFLSSSLIVLLAFALLGSGGFADLWPIFGSANQLLAALALLAIAAWLLKSRSRAWFVVLPMFFMFAVTISSLLLFARQKWMEQALMLSVIAVALCGLAMALLVLAVRSLKTGKK